MAATSVREPALANRVAASPLSLVVADASWYSTSHLFSALERPGLSTLLLRCLDYRNALDRGWMPWSWPKRLEQVRPALWERDLVLPTGWMKSFPRWGMRPIARVIDQWRDAHAQRGRLVLVMTYPHYLYLRDLVRPDLTVYYNIDDYSQYWPNRARRVNALERAAVAESDLTTCVSRLRAGQLRALVPHSADRIHHLGHGAPAPTVADTPRDRPLEPPPELAAIPGPRLGYVGTLEDRVDWELLDGLARRRPDASLVFVGEIHPRSNRKAEAWTRARARCLARPNVHLVGWKPQHELSKWIQAFDICLIPYQVEHPFNQVCSPTKIMDYMGSGRPIVATNLPECQLHAERFDVAGSVVEFEGAIDRLLQTGCDDGRAPVRHAYALENRCDRVARRLLDRLGV